VNNVDKHLDFKASEEVNIWINYLDLTIHRNTNKMDLNVQRKPTHADITIEFSSNQPQDHKLAAFTYYINRMLTLLITEQAREQEWNKILTLAQNNRFSKHTIYNLEKKLTSKQKKKTPPKRRTNNTKNKINNIHVSQPLSKNRKYSVQKIQHQYRLQINQHNTPTTISETG
jgi:hypothetical protein